MTRKQSEIRKTIKVLRDVLATEQSSTWDGHLKEALKTRLARLKIPYTVDTVEAALDAVGQHRWQMK